MPEVLKDVFLTGQCVYMEDLKNIVSRKANEARVVPPPPPIASFSYPHPPCVSGWQQYLEGNPDSEFVTVLLEGISNAFMMGTQQ